MRVKSKKGQGILEYAMILSIVVAVIVAIQIYVKRALEGKFKQSADQIGEQFTAAQNYTIQTVSQSARREQTLANLTVGTGGWTRSQIQDSSAWTPANYTYAGYEATQTDYVTAQAGSGQRGAHGTFDSGKISNVSLFEDD
ncbi:hypothetical protein EPN16_03250 [bacterium]|nr:MAG: hypothetical protein EPN16_03250 [bacterium]